MDVFHEKREIRSFLNQERSKDKTVGLVPTMGALHQGHLSLVSKSVSENDVTVVSVFVNPTQFDNPDDLEKYPRKLQADLDLLKAVSEDIAVFSPAVSEMYGEKITSEQYDFDGLDKVMEGEFRSGHFEGVGTIVEALLNTVTPDRAYFGEKDFQQLQIIKKLVAKRKIPVEIVGCPIERETHGLAMSSRNERLSAETRLNAGFIYQTLKAAKEKFGTESAKYIADWVRSQFNNQNELKLEYFEIADEETLTPVLTKQEDMKYRGFIAVYANEVRLIDNLRLN
ncbi:pantoate--beta-alanine ligase [Flagellimonas allohymeniacidonis]|uniref:Pantothenate synthetase n=1 Tax=Flagellimonas allohymeniacidonis TaxID=2517819 RepID=A0A4Q8QCZ4_9FLAO|nr:pantoate--beta-alanine ligase [Allomuricauda hymeniacidonis]TAI48221.1 pantoate--beta-alanine ligase [Allomuricauda hymeniacidonis]